MVAPVSQTIAWRLARAGDGLPDLADAMPWLSPPERDRAQQFRVEKRRLDWLLGRLNLKALVHDVVAERFLARVAPADIVIERLSSGAPRARLGPEAPPVARLAPGDVLPLSVSNSHSHGRALGAAWWTDALAPHGLTGAVGIDLELIESRTTAFVRDFLTRDEQAFWEAGQGDERHLRANLVWSAKEAVLKVLQRGLSADTWWLTCLPVAGDETMADSPDGDDRRSLLAGLRLTPSAPRWNRFVVACDPRLGADDVAFDGRWCTIDGFVLTLAAGVALAPRPSAPLRDP